MPSFSKLVWTICILTIFSSGSIQSITVSVFCWVRDFPGLHRGRAENQTGGCPGGVRPVLRHFHHRGGQAAWSTLIGPEPPDTVLSLVENLQTLCSHWSRTSRHSALIGPEPPDTVLSLVELYYAGARVYAITTHLKASKMPLLATFYALWCLVVCYGMIGGFHARKKSIIGDLMP